MKKKVVLAVTLSVVVLLAAIAAGINAVFSVTSVKVQFQAFSSRTKEEVAVVQAELDGFVGRSLIALDLAEVSAVVAKYPYFEVTAIEKQFPQTVALSLKEKEELFAVKVEGGYSLYDGAGSFLRTSEKNSSRADGAELILLEGMEAGSERFALAVSICSQMQKHLPDLRMNLVSVAYVAPSANPADDYLSFVMREGAVMELHNPAHKGEVKAQLAIAKYLEIMDEDRMYGRILVLDSKETNEPTVQWTVER